MQIAVARLLLLVVLAAALTGCSVVGGIFKAGMAVGIFVVVIVIAVLFLVFGRR